MLIRLSAINDKFRAMHIISWESGYQLIPAV